MQSQEPPPDETTFGLLLDIARFLAERDLAEEKRRKSTAPSEETAELQDA